MSTSDEALAKKLQQEMDDEDLAKKLEQEWNGGATYPRRPPSLPETEFDKVCQRVVNMVSDSEATKLAGKETLSSNTNVHLTYSTTSR
jgi:hypothetical protein